MEWGAGIWGLTLRRNRKGKGNWLAQEGSGRAGQCSQGCPFLAVGPWTIT